MTKGAFTRKLSSRFPQLQNMAEDPGQTLARSEFSNRPTSREHIIALFHIKYPTNSSRHAHLKEAQECFEIGLGLAFTRRESRLEEPPARNN